MKNTKYWTLFSLLFFLFLFLRWNSFSTPFERDEGEYAYSAMILRQGELPYENAFLQKPPPIIYVYALGQLISPEAVWPPRLLAVVFVAFTTFFVYQIAKKSFGKTAGWVAAFIFTPIVASPINSSLAANTENFMILPLTALVYLYLIKKEGWQHLFLAGALSALAILFKPICLYVVLFVFLAWIYRKYKSGQGLSEYLRLFIFSGLGGLITTLVIISPFLLSDGGKALWEQVVVFNSYYARHWGYGLATLFTNLGVMLKSFWLVFIFVLIFAFNKARNKWFFVGLLLFSLLGVYQSTIRHYYILLMPFLAIVAAGAVDYLSKQDYLKKHLKSPSLLITLAIIASVLWPVREQFGKTPEELSIWIYGNTNPFYEAPLVAEKLKTITSKDDRVFVAGSEPQILFYSNRKSVSRFVITYPLIVDTPVRADYQKQAIDDIEKNLPEAIVLSQRQHSGLWDEKSPRKFIDFLFNKLEEEYVLVGGYVWVADRGFWVEGPSEEDIENSSLLLYKKRDK